MQYTFKDRATLFAVYEIIVDGLPIWIGHAALLNVYNLPDTKGNEIVDAHKAMNVPLTVNILHIAPSKETAKAYIQLHLAMATASGNYDWRIQHEGTTVLKPAGRPSKGEVMEMTTGETFDSAAHAARHFGVNVNSVSKNLRNIEGYARVKGKYKFRYVEG